MAKIFIYKGMKYNIPIAGKIRATSRSSAWKKLLNNNIYPSSVEHLKRIPAGTRTKTPLDFYVNKKGYADYKKGRGVHARDVLFEQYEGSIIRPVKWLR